MPPIPGAKTAMKQTRGGFYSASVYSGAVAPGLNCAPGAAAVGSDICFASGPGRLDTVVLWVDKAASGQQVGLTFYDAAAPVSGGPIYASGHRILANIPSFMPQVVGAGLAVASGVESNFYPAFGTTISIDSVFQSGLCFNSRSGQPGFTVTWTPEQPGGQ